MERLRPPAPPTFLTVSDIQENSAVFHWKSPDNEKGQSPPARVTLTVLYMNGSVCTEHTIEVADGSDHTTVTDLDPGVQYAASIKSCSYNGVISENATFLHGLGTFCTKCKPHYEMISRSIGYMMRER